MAGAGLHVFVFGGVTTMKLRYEASSHTWLLHQDVRRSTDEVTCDLSAAVVHITVCN